MYITYYLADKPITVDKETDYIKIEVNGNKFIIQETLNPGELRIDNRDNELNMTIKGYSHILIN